MHFQVERFLKFVSMDRYIIFFTISPKPSWIREHVWHPEMALVFSVTGSWCGQWKIGIKRWNATTVGHHITGCVVEGMHGTHSLPASYLMVNSSQMPSASDPYGCFRNI